MSEAAFLLDPGNLPVVFPPALRERVAARLLTIDSAQTRETILASPEAFSAIRVLLTGWGVPTLDAPMLDAMPNLELVAHGAGSVKPLVSDAFWERGVRLTHAADANAQAVAETTYAFILLALKDAWRTQRATLAARTFVRNTEARGMLGGPVGLVSLGAIGRYVARHLRQRLPEVSVLAYDPFLDAEVAEEFGVKTVPLEELFETSQVLSLHTPLLPETRGMFGEALLRRLPDRATLINTARGGLIDESALQRLLRDRPDVTAVLDVTDPEPPLADSPWWDLPNAVIYPHLAGASGLEAELLGRQAVDEALRYLDGEPLRFELQREQLARMA